MGLPKWALQTKAGEKYSGRANRFAFGVSLNMLAGLFQLVGSFLSTIILSRMITAEDFGIYGMVLPFVTSIMILSDGGAVYYSLRNDRLEERELSFAFWYGVAISAVLFLLLLPAAPLIGKLMNEPSAVQAALGAGLAILVTGLGFQHNALISRCFRNDLRALAIVVSVVLSVALGIAAAYFGMGYWALIVLFVSRNAIQTAMAWKMTGWIPLPPRPDFSLFKRITRLGIPELYSRLLLNILRDSDKILVGILFSTKTAGYYALAHMLCIMPLRQIIAPVFSVAIPYLSDAREDREALYDKFRQIFSLFVFALWPAAVFFALYADDFIAVIIGAEMMPSSDFVPFLLIAGVLSMSNSFISIIFQATDRPGITARQNTYLAGIIILSLAVGALTGQARMIALAIAVANFISLVLRWKEFAHYFQQHIGRSLSPLAVPLLLTALLPLATLALDRSLGLNRLIQTPALYILAVTAVFSALMAGAMLVFYRAEIRSLQLAKRWKSRKPRGK